MEKEQSLILSLKQAVLWQQFIAAFKYKWCHFHSDPHDNPEAFLNKPTTRFMTLNAAMVIVITILLCSPAAWTKLYQLLFLA